MKFDPQKKLAKCIKTIIKQFGIIDKIVVKVLEQKQPAKKVAKKRGRKA